MSDRLLLTRELVEELCARVDRSSLPDADCTVIKACIRYCLMLGEAYAQKTTTIHKLLRMIFPRSPEVKSPHPGGTGETAPHPTQAAGR
jgi:hypothetical protein